MATISTAAKNHWEVFSSQAARTSRSLKNLMDILVIIPRPATDTDQVPRILQSLVLNNPIYLVDL